VTHEPYYDDGTVTIYHGDCREILPALAPQSVDLLLTDPPYGVNYAGRGAHAVMAGDGGDLDVRAALASALRCLILNRHFYVFGPLDVAPLTQGATCDLVWDEGKTGLGDLSLPWGPSHERVVFGVWNPYKSQAGNGRGLVRRRRGTVLRYPTPNNGRGATVHPTRKPVPLLRELIEASSLMGETVLDPFMGSGSTLEAAQLEGRRVIGIEIEERYCEIAAERCAQEVLDLAAA
jgi:DNA modification methylase